MSAEHHARHVTLYPTLAALKVASFVIKSMIGLWLSSQVLNGLPVSLRGLTLDGGTGVRKFHSGFPPTIMPLSHLTRLTRLTLRNFAW